MILKRLYIENFLAHDNTEIHFAPRGITAFIGENGAGKSSILEAISYALTGSSYKGKAKDLVKWGKNEAKVILELNKDGIDYKIERKIKLRGKKASTEGAIYQKKNGKYILFYQKELNKNIPKLTGLTSKVFFNTILVKQGEIEGLINLQPSKRAEIIQELLDITLYDLISKKFAEIRKKLQNVIEAKLPLIENMEEVEEEIQKLKEEEEKLRERLQKIQEKKEKVEQEIKELKIERKKIEEKIKEINKKEQLKVKLEESLKNIKEKIAELNEEIQKIQQKKEIIKEYKPYLDQLERAKQKLEKLNQIETLKTKLSSIKEKLEKIEELEEIEKKLREIAEEYEKKEKEKEEINKQLKELNKLKGNLQAILENEKRLKKELNNYITSCKNIAFELAKMKQIYKPLELNPTLINQYLVNIENDIKQTEKRLTEKKGELKVIKTEGERLKEQIKDIQNLKGECPTCLRPIEEHSKEEILKELETKINELREKFKKTKEEIKQLEEQLNMQKEIKTKLEEYKKIYDIYIEREKSYKETKIERHRIEIQLEKLQNIENVEKEIKEYLQVNKQKYLEYKRASEELKKTDKQKLLEEFNKIQKEVITLEKQTENITAEQLKREIQELEKKKEEYIKLENYISKEEEIKGNIEQLKEKLEQTTKQLSEIQNITAQREKIEQKLYEIDNQISQIEAQNKEISDELTKIKSEHSSKETLLKSKEKELEEKRKIEKDIETTRNKLKKAKKLEVALSKDGIQKYLIDIALYELPKITNELFSNFGFPFEQIKFENNFDIKLKMPTLEKTERIVSIQSISGGQRIALALALRLALVQFLSTKAEFLILDEPTIHLDETRRNELVNLLIQLKNQSQNKGLIKQLIIVSHDTELKDTADNIYHVERGKVDTEKI